MLSRGTTMIMEIWFLLLMILKDQFFAIGMNNKLQPIDFMMK